jgi:LysM repeat protein
MSLKEKIKADVTIGLIATAVGISGCSLFHHAEAPTESTATTAQAPESQTEAPAQDLTATEAAVARAESASDQAAAQVAQPSGGLTADALQPNAPKQYTVKRGDTLWEIASMFLKDPWLWPEIWYVNPQIANPHLIYPGDVLALAYGADGRPQVRLEQGGAARLDPRLRSSPLDSAIPTIPYAAIGAFLSRPSLVTSDEVKRAPHVVAFRDDHQIGGAGHEVYIRGLGDVPQGARFNVMHIGEKLHDPESGKTLGYEGIYTATAVVEVPGDSHHPAKAMLIDSAHETVAGDCLFADQTVNPIDFVPRAPSTDVRGRIVSVVNSVHVIGQYDIVALNRGKNHGVEPGTVLAVDQAGDVVPDRGAARYEGSTWGYSFLHHVKLPDERAGTVLVFKSYDRMSYALVVGASGPMRVADVVRNP